MDNLPPKQSDKDGTYIGGIVARFFESAAQFFEFLRDLVTKRRFRVALFLATTGLVAIILSHRIESPDARPKLLSIIISELGVAALVTAVAEFVLLEHATREMLSQNYMLLGKVREDFGIVIHSIDQGLTDVLLPRRGDQHKSVLEINSILEQARDEVRIIGFSLREFLDGSQPLYRTVLRALKNDDNVHLKLLLIDPNCEAAHLRTVVEQGKQVNFKEGELYNDVVASVRSLQALVKQASTKQQFKLEAKFHNIHPPFYMLATSDILFIEPYHLGHYPDDPPCIGGFVPLLQFISKSEMYERACTHFDYMWNSEESITQESRQAGEDKNSWRDGQFLKVKSLNEIAKSLENIDLAEPTKGLL